MDKITGIVTGVDVVDVERFKKIMEASGRPFLERIFFEAELSDVQPEHLAGIFAAKEAVKKAFEITEDIWHKVEIRKRPSRKPEAVLHFDPEMKVISTDVSISHDGNSAVATFVALVENKF